MASSTASGRQALRHRMAMLAGNGEGCAGAAAAARAGAGHGAGWASNFRSMGKDAGESRERGKNEPAEGSGLHPTPPTLRPSPPLPLQRRRTRDRPARACGEENGLTCWPQRRPYHAPERGGPAGRDDRVRHKTTVGEAATCCSPTRADLKSPAEMVECSPAGRTPSQPRAMWQIEPIQPHGCTRVSRQDYPGGMTSQEVLKRKLARGKMRYPAA